MPFDEVERVLQRKQINNIWLRGFVFTKDFKQRWLTHLRWDVVHWMVFVTHWVRIAWWIWRLVSMSSSVGVLVGIIRWRFVDIRLKQYNQLAFLGVRLCVQYVLSYYCVFLSVRHENGAKNCANYLPRKQIFVQIDLNFYLEKELFLPNSLQSCCRNTNSRSKLWETLSAIWSGIKISNEQYIFHCSLL